jgi:hypothetical protein
MRLPEFLMRQIRRWRDNYVATHEPDFYIGGREDPYLIRWWVIPRNKWLNLYLHKIIKSDRDEALHDHPWINCSLVVDGEYEEITILAGGVERISPLSSGQLRLRRPSTAHRLVVRQNEPVFTLFATGPVWRHWGFHCPKGWRHWKDFVGFHDENENIAGRGCGEMDGPALAGGRIRILAPLARSSGKRPD